MVIFFDLILIGGVVKLMKLYVEKQSMVFIGTFKELKDWLGTFPQEWTLGELLSSHLH